MQRKNQYLIPEPVKHTSARSVRTPPPTHSTSRDRQNHRAELRETHPHLRPTLSHSAAGCSPGFSPRSRARDRGPPCLHQSEPSPAPWVSLISVTLHAWAWAQGEAIQVTPARQFLPCRQGALGSRGLSVTQWHAPHGRLTALRLHSFHSFNTLCHFLSSLWQDLCAGRVVSPVGRAANAADCPAAPCTASQAPATATLRISLDAFVPLGKPVAPILPTCPRHTAPSQGCQALVLPIEVLLGLFSREALRAGNDTGPP